MMKNETLTNEQLTLMRVALAAQIKTSYRNRKLDIFRSDLRKEVAALRTLRRACKVTVKKF